MNKGIKVATGKYLQFLNSGDCLVNGNVLGNVIPLLNGKDIYVGDEQVGSHIFHSDVSTDSKILYQMIFLYGLPHQSTFLHQNIFITYGLYREDKRIVSDWWIFYKSLILGNATIAKLPFIISVFDKTGISSINNIIAIDKVNDFFSRNSTYSLLSLFLS